MPSIVLPSHQQMASHTGHHAGHHGCPCHSHTTEADLKLLDALTAPKLVVQTRFKRRDAHFDPLLLVATAMSGPHVTRHHYHHGFSVADADLLAQPAPAQAQTAPLSSAPSETRARYTSKQAPRKERLAALSARDVNKENASAEAVETSALKPRRNSLLQAPGVASAPVSPYLASPAKPLTSASEPVEVQCLVRTRIPTAHGEIFLHLYRNNRDGKEHMAIVVDPAQLHPLNVEIPASTVPAPAFIRSRSLDARWSDGETDMDRVVRGAYVGRLSSSVATSAASHAALEQLLLRQQRQATGAVNVVPPPLVRIHSECFTGETVGSMRCDCGEQLDEAVRRISQPILVSTPSGPVSVPGRGVIVYMRQEGRGIGLLSKLRAYNLQDLGHDTVAANIMLGHGADERRYELAAAILRDLGLGDSSNDAGEGVRLLTNNPDKISALSAEGVHVVSREEMVPRAWRCDTGDGTPDTDSASDITLAVPDGERLGVHTPRGEDLDRYLKTKITRMGHMLHAPVPLAEQKEIA